MNPILDHQETRGSLIRVKFDAGPLGLALVKVTINNTDYCAVNSLKGQALTANKLVAGDILVGLNGDALVGFFTHSKSNQLIDYMKVLAEATHRSICFFRLDKDGTFILPTKNTNKYGELLIVEKYQPIIKSTSSNPPSPLQILNSPQFVNLSQLSSLSVEELSKLDSSLGSIIESPLKGDGGHNTNKYATSSRPGTTGSAQSYLPPLEFTKEEASQGQRGGQFKLPEGQGIVGRFIKQIRATPHFVQVKKDEGFDGEIHFTITDENGKDFDISGTENYLYDYVSNQVKRDIKRGKCTVRQCGSHLANLANLASKPFDRRHRMPVIRSMRKVKPKHKKKHSYNVVSIARGQHPKIIADNKAIIQQHDDHKEEMEALAKRLEAEYESNSDVSCEHDHKIHLHEEDEMAFEHEIEVQRQHELKLQQNESIRKEEEEENVEQEQYDGDTEHGNGQIYEDDNQFNAIVIHQDSNNYNSINGDEMKYSDLEGKRDGILKNQKSPIINNNNNNNMGVNNTNNMRMPKSILVDSAVNTSRPNSRQSRKNSPIMVDTAVGTSRPSSRINARKSPKTMNNSPMVEISTMTSSSSRPNSSSSSLRPGSRQSGRNNKNSRPNTPNVVRFKETVEINIGKPPVYGKNMGDEYYNKIGPSPPKASKRALKRGGHRRPRTSDDNYMRSGNTGSNNYVQNQMNNNNNNNNNNMFPGIMNNNTNNNSNPEPFMLPGHQTVAQQQQQVEMRQEEEDARYVNEQYEKFQEDADDETDGKFGDSFDNRLLTATPTMRLSETELARLKKIEEIRTQQNVTLVQIIEIERRLEEQRITMLTNALPNDRKRLKNVFAKERRQAGENIRLLVQKHQKELKQAMIAMGVAFLSNSIHDPDGNMMNREKPPSLGNGSNGSKKRKNDERKIDKVKS